MPFDNWLELLKKRAQRVFFAQVPDDHVLDIDYHPTPIRPDEGYFEIRVSEMFLSYKSEYGRSFVPFAVVGSEFSYDGKRRTFPFFVGSELLKDIDADANVKSQDINYRNTRVVGPVPYRGDDVGLFVGLYRIQVDDFAKRLLGVLGQIAGVFDVSRLSSYIDVAGVLTDGLYGLFNCDEVEYRIGRRDVFQDHGSPLFRQNYLVYVNCEENALEANHLWVKDGTLRIGPTKDTCEALRDYDYCLVNIQHLDKRSDYSTLDFNKTWKQAYDRISKGDQGIGHSLFLECCRQIEVSPELTPWHAQYLIELYIVRYTKAVELYDRLHKLSPERTATVYRDAKGGVLSPRLNLQRTAQLASQAGVDETDLQGLMDLHNNWDRIPHLDVADTEITDTELGDQLTAIQNFTTSTAPNPKGLAEALTIASATAR